MLHIKLKRMTHAATQYNILSVDPPLGVGLQGVGSKGQNSTFSEHCHVAYQIKGKDECRHIFCPYTHLDPGVRSKVKLFSKGCCI